MYLTSHIEDWLRIR